MPFASRTTEPNAQGSSVTTDRPTLVDPPIEPMLEACEGSKFTLVRVASMRAREINSYWNGLGRGEGSIIPPQVNSNSNKSLTMAFEEISEGKLEMHRKTDEEIKLEEEAEAAKKAAAQDELQAAFSALADSE